MSFKTFLESLGPTKWEYRPDQEALVARILEAFEKVDDVILEAPTGTGKSLVGLCVAEAIGSSYVLTAEKVLQDQYERDFPIAVLKGKDNYPCALLPGMTASQCFFKLGMCKRLCKYLKARDEMVLSRRAALNYALFLQLADVDAFFLSPRDILIMDEAHTVEDVVTNYAAVPITYQLYETGIQLMNSIPDWLFYKEEKREYVTNLLEQFSTALGQTIEYISTGKTREVWKMLCQIHSPMVNAKIEISAALETIEKSEESAELLKEAKRFLALFGVFERVCCKYSNYFKHDTGWIIEIDEDGARILPVRISRYIPPLLKRYSKKRLWMSATIGSPEQFAKSLGIDNYIYIKTPMTFPVENRVILFAPYGSINYNLMSDARNLQNYAESIANLVARLQSIGAGVVHTANYKLAKAVTKHLLVRGVKVFTHTDSNSRDDAILRFIEENGILVSPSVFQGLDLKNDAARWQIIAKVPYDSLGSPIVKERQKVFGNDWYAWRAALKVVQATGRAVRSKEDWAITIVTDSNFSRLYKFFPDWYKEAIVKVDLSTLYGVDWKQLLNR